MTADAAIVRDLGILLWFTIGCLILAVGLVIWMEGKVFNGCPSCAHCSNRRKLREDEQERLRQEYERRWGVRTLEGEDEDSPSPEAQAPSDRDGGEGHAG